MSTPSLGAGSAGDVEGLATEVIGKHYGVVKFNGFWCCACLIVLANTKVDAKVRYDAHLATAVLASDWLAAHVARASTADRERVARVEALALEWETEFCHRNIGPQFAARLRAALAAPLEQEGT